MTGTIGRILDAARPVLPVVTLDRVDRALPLADALAGAGVTTLEITLRTPAALDAIRTLRAARPELVVGAGTVLEPDQLAAVQAAGGRFAVSPGLSLSLLARANDLGIPYLPGVATMSEVMTAREHGFTHLKLFPAFASGGGAFLRAVAAVLPDVRFCPTGGVAPDNCKELLTLDNVVCVGGSWVAPRSAIDAGRWADIEARARRAVRGAAAQDAEPAEEF